MRLRRAAAARRLFLYVHTTRRNVERVVGARMIGIFLFHRETLHGFTLVQTERT